MKIIDEYDYISQQAKRIKQHLTIEEPDYLAEYLTEMARKDERELKSKTINLISYMLKCDFQPTKTSPSWHRNIKINASDISDIVTTSKTLYNFYLTHFQDWYKQAIDYAVIDTGLSKSTFPSNCPYNETNLINESYINKFINTHSVQPPI